MTPLDEVLRELGRIQAAPGGAVDLYQFRSLVTAHQYRPLYSALARHFAPKDRLLDWGCGNGHASWTAARLGWGDLTGFAFGPFRLLRDMPEGYTFVPGDPADPVTLPFPDACFDGVLSVGVLEHVSEAGGNEDASLREIKRVLRPGGRFLCAHFPNRGSWIEFLARRIPGKTRHHRLYGRGDIERLARSAGLELLELRSYGFLPRNAWARAPGAVRNAAAVARAWDALDDALSALLPGFVQNHLWVARRPG